MTEEQAERLITLLEQVVVVSENNLELIKLLHRRINQVEQLLDLRTGAQA